MKLRFILVIESEVTNLADYKATTIQEAAKNQACWIEEGECDLTELVNRENVAVTVEGIE